MTHCIKTAGGQIYQNYRRARGSVDDSALVTLILKCIDQLKPVQPKQKDMKSPRKERRGCFQQMKIWFGTNCFLYHGTVHLISIETLLHFTDLILNWIEMILNGRATCLLSHRQQQLLPMVILIWGFPGARGAAASSDDGGSRMPLCQQQRLEVAGRPI